MMLPILLKLLFVILLAGWLLPSVSKGKNRIPFAIKFVTFFTLFILLEVLVSDSGWVDSDHNLGEHKKVIWVNIIIYFILLSVCFAWFFTKEWIKNEKQKRKMIEIQLTTELNFLKSQINPHFLFNTLNNLVGIAQKNGQEELVNGISKLSHLMRYMLYDSSVDKVHLSKEIDYIQNFISLYKLRYGSGELQVDFTVTGNVNGRLISPMILIPFIENSFKHGVKIEKESIIKISISISDKLVVFRCENKNYEKQFGKEEYGGIGLENVKRRLDLLYSGKHSLLITSGENFVVHLELME